MSEQHFLLRDLQFSRFLEYVYTCAHVLLLIQSCTIIQFVELSVVATFVVICCRIFQT